MTPWAQLTKAERTQAKHQNICYKDLACAFTIISSALHRASINACWMNELAQFLRNITIWNTVSLMKMSICKVCTQFKPLRFANICAPFLIHWWPSNGTLLQTVFKGKQYLQPSIPGRCGLDVRGGLSLHTIRNKLYDLGWVILPLVLCRFYFPLYKDRGWDMALKACSSSSSLQY